MIGLGRELSDIDPWLYFKASILTGVLAGIVGGSTLVIFWIKWLRTKTYRMSLLSILGTYTAVYFVVDIPTGLFSACGELGLPLNDVRVWQEVLSTSVNIESLHGYLFWLFVLLGTLIVLLVNDKYGPGMFRNFLLGKYFHPKREERIFMFIDLRSSTAIAEKLGEERYFNFLKDVFTHATPSILNANGEIYEYVGDEIIISWVTEKGVENANCIQCYFDIQKALNEKADYFDSTYQVKPEFKAGLHYGNVMTGEIGVVKRDIAFSGDVLNTTSRIQGLCSELGVDILLSKYLLEKLSLRSNSYEPRKMGDIELRGREQPVVLFTVSAL